MMNYQQFKDKWLGKRVDTDGAYGYQCVDLIQQYRKEVFGDSGRHGNAYQRRTLGPRKNWKAIKNIFGDLNCYPQPGDIVYFKMGKYGHVAIVDKADGYNLRILEQNGVGGGSGRGGNAIRVRKVSYKYCVGRFRWNKAEPKPVPQPKPVDHTAETMQIEKLKKQVADLTRERDERKKKAESKTPEKLPYPVVELGKTGGVILKSS